MVISMSDFLIDVLCGDVKTRWTIGFAMFEQWVFNVKSINRGQRILNGRPLSPMSERP